MPTASTHYKGHCLTILNHALPCPLLRRGQAAVGQKDDRKECGEIGIKGMSRPWPGRREQFHL